MALKSPSAYFQKNKTSAALIAPEVTESYVKFMGNLDEINQRTKAFEDLSKKVEELSNQLAEKLSRTDVENVMLSHLMVVDENFKELQNQVKGLNRRDLKEFKDTAYNLNELIENLIEVELPSYKNNVTKNEIFVGEQVSQLREEVDESINDVRDEVESKIVEFFDVVEQNFENIQQQVQESSDQIQNTTQVYGNLSKILENKILKENDKFEEYSNLIESISNSFEELSRVLKEELEEISKYTEEQFELHQQEVKNIQEQFESSVEIQLDDYRKELVDVKAEVVINEQHIKNVDKYLQEYHQDLIQVKEEVFSEIESLPIGNLQENIERLEKKIDLIKETYSQIEPEVIIKEVIQESNFTEPPETKNSDPLTPLDQNFVTLEQLQQHYRLFLNRIQQQLSTLGGGGETQLKYLDDIVGIATNPSAYDGKYLKYNHSIKKFEFVTVSGGGGGGESYWVSTNVGIHTLSNVGIGTTVPTSTLTVVGDSLFVGIVTATDFNSASDIKLKDNVNVIENPIDKVLKLEGVNFQWKYSGKKSLGVIAQKVEEVLPELVSGDENKTVNYNGIVGLLIECIKEQQKEIGELKKLINK